MCAQQEMYLILYKELNLDSSHLQKLGRKVSLESNNVIIEKYPPSAKFPMDYFYPGPPLDQSGSNSSTSQYRVSQGRL